MDTLYIGGHLKRIGVRLIERYMILPVIEMRHEAYG